MGPAAQVAVVATGAVAALLLVTVLTARAARARREELAAELARARADVEALGGRVAVLAEELEETRRAAAADHEHVITSLAGSGLGGRDPAGSGAAEQPGSGVLEARLLSAHRPSRGRVIEGRLVDGLARSGSSASGRVADLFVRTLAVGHGVRRALAPEVLDRAAAESHVARRRSRRDRRKELRDARRLLREGTVKVQDVA